MKLLSWMHRKLQKDDTGSLQASVVGNPCNCFLVTPRNDSRQLWQPKQCCQDNLEEIDPKSTEEFNEEQSTDIFPGFLTIGTLSLEPISEPPTPTFDITYHVPDDSAMTDMTYDLKLINEELEKFLKVEAEKEGSTESSRKNSQASTITLRDEVNEDVSDHNSIKKQLYPLQGYLLGSSTELLENRPKEKKERTSLYDLFKSTTMDTSSIRATDRTQKEDTKEIKSSNHKMKKMQQTTQATPDKSNHFDGHAAFLNLRKLKKINRLFHKKIHPEISKTEFAAKEPKSSKGEKKKNLKSSNSYADSVLRYGESTIGCWGALKKGKKIRSKTHIKHLQNVSTKKIVDLEQEDTSGGGEHWIKTDEEYFVLELQQEEGVQTSGLKVNYI